MLSVFLYLCLSVVTVAQNRSYDGTDNNLLNPDWGSAESKLRYITTLTYSDFINAPTGIDRPNPRLISNRLFDQDGLIYDEHDLSDFVWVFGQFIDHEIEFVENSNNENVTIRVPECDAVFDPDCRGNSIIPMRRSKIAAGTGTSPSNPRKVSNATTAWIDGSSIYGSDETRALWLRTFHDGKLKVSTGDFPPFNTLSGEINGATDMNAPKMDMQHLPSNRVFVTGDTRANENVLLITMHTIFIREHNRLCDELKGKYPNASDEQLYQKARKIIGGFMQRITFDEWLPALGIRLEPYKGYKSDINPNILNVFSSAAFKFGYTLQSHKILRINDQCEEMPEGHMGLRKTFFNPILIMTSGIDPFIKGMSAQIQQELDVKIIDEIRNFHYESEDVGKGIDLAAISINRGRERGLPDYSTVREEIGLGRLKSFDEISRDVEDLQILRELYGDVNNIDPLVGMLAEEHVPNAILGETMMSIVKDQFLALRDADRCYYEIDPGLTLDEIQEIKSTRLSDIILRNTSLQTIQEEVFVKNRTCYSLDITTNHLELLVFPNPILSDFDLAVFSYREGKADMIISNHLGQIVDMQTLDISKGTNLFSMNLSADFPPSLYQIRIELEQQSNAVKFLKIR